MPMSVYPDASTSIHKIKIWILILLFRTIFQGLSPAMKTRSSLAKSKVISSFLTLGEAMMIIENKVYLYGMIDKKHYESNIETARALILAHIKEQMIAHETSSLQ